MVLTWYRHFQRNGGLNQIFNLFNLFSGYRVRGIYFASFCTIFRLDFVTIPIVWYLLFIYPLRCIREETEFLTIVKDAPTFNLVFCSISGFFMDIFTTHCIFEEGLNKAMYVFIYMYLYSCVSCVHFNNNVN